MRPGILEQLRPYQRDKAELLLAILRTNGVGFDLSDTGTGKTYIAAAIAAELKQPCLVVAPKISLTSWERASEQFNDSTCRIGWELLRTGNTDFGKWEFGAPPPREQRTFFKCQCCQRLVNPEENIPCSAHFAGIHCLETKLKPHRYGKFTFHSAVKLLIFDEIHRAAGDSLNAEMVIAAKRQGIPTLGLTATLAQTPLQLRATGYLAGLHRLVDYPLWCGRRGCRRVPMRGMQWLVSGSEQERIMRAIGSEIIPSKGIRITTSEIPDFPERSIQAELYDLPAEETAEMVALYGVLSDSLDALAERQALDVAQDHPLTLRLRARQRIELLKIPLATELGEDYLEKGHSVVWFVNFRQTIDELLKRFPQAGIIDGTVTGDKRQRSIDHFQSNQTRQLIVNNQAGGVALSLHDLRGEFPRAGLVFPCDSAVVMQQLFGRLARSGGRSTAVYKVLFAAKTVEVKMRRSVALKIKNGAALTDDDLAPKIN